MTYERTEGELELDFLDRRKSLLNTEECVFKKCCKKYKKKGKHCKKCPKI